MDAMKYVALSTIKDCNRIDIAPLHTVSMASRKTGSAPKPLAPLSVKCSIPPNRHLRIATGDLTDRREEERWFCPHGPTAILAGRTPHRPCFVLKYRASEDFPIR
jgi:hypothetical protein